jgi:hypothetical protein
MSDESRGMEWSAPDIENRSTPTERRRRVDPDKT